MLFWSNLAIIPILLVALFAIRLVAPILRIEAPKHQYASIDGLRGFLAMFVFLHHAAFWYYFSYTQRPLVPTDLYNHFGTTSVALFFMITAFLFISKLIEAYDQSFDWLKLYISRVLRIMPLYLFAMMVLLLIVCILSHFVLKESLWNLFLQMVQWLFFMEPNINHLSITKMINGVQWSLAYEWMFYCSLPIIGWLGFRIPTSSTVILISGIFFAIFLFVIFYAYPEFRGWTAMSPFLGGAAAAFLAKNEKVRRLFSANWIAPILVLFLGIAVTFFSTVFEIIPYLCVTIFFIGIACGNKLFGLLTFKASRLLGQVSYSVYLLHGPLLFITFYFVLGNDKAKLLSPLQHWEIIAILTFVLILVCGLTYQFIERPCLEGASSLTKMLRRYLKRVSSTAVLTSVNAEAAKN